MEETPAERKARLKALRAAAEDAGALQPQSDDEPPLKFRNYVPRDEELRAAKVDEPKAPEPELPAADAAPAGEDGGDDDGDTLLTLQPKKANWDLQRDVERKLAKLERRTQKAMIDLMRVEEQKRLAKED